MNMAGYNKLVPEIVASSIWNESAETRIVWITLLATKNQDGYVRGDARTIGRMANVSTENAKVALELFQQPDPMSGTPDNEGRRIAPHNGGWMVLNHDLYRERGMSESNKEYWRNKKREQRANKNKTDTETEESETCLGQFERCWKLYPNKSGSKHKALQAYKQSKPIEQDVIDGIERYKAFVASEHRRGFAGLKYANGQTWFNQRRWESEYEVDQLKVEQAGTCNGAVI